MTASLTQFEATTRAQENMIQAGAILDIVNMALEGGARPADSTLRNALWGVGDLMNQTCDLIGVISSESKLTRMRLQNEMAALQTAAAKARSKKKQSNKVARLSSKRK